MQPSQSVRERPDYGVDAPYVIWMLSASGLICLLLALTAASLRWLFSPTISLLATAGVMLYASKIGKLRLREQLLDLLPWNENEKVLDVGCGSGLLLIAAAKRAVRGRAVGVDIWRAADLANNGLQATLRNARIEGVSERVTVQEGDARRLPFDAATFDAIVSLNVLHNIAERDGREKALTEIARVLKPGGRLVIADFRNIGEYVRLLRKSGMATAEKKRVGWVLFFPVFAAVGVKPSD